MNLQKPESNIAKVRFYFVLNLLISIFFLNSYAQALKDIHISYSEQNSWDVVGNILILSISLPILFFQVLTLWSPNFTRKLSQTLYSLIIVGVIGITYFGLQYFSHL